MKRITPLSFHIERLTPWAAWRSPRDQQKRLFLPLFSLALVVLAGLIIYLLKLEAMYREDAGRSSTGPTAESQKAPPLSAEGSINRFPTEYGADIVGQRKGQPQLNW